MEVPCHGVGGMVGMLSADPEEAGLDVSQHGEIMQDMTAFVPASEPQLAKIA